MAESPEIRIGTAEREEAMQRLSEHFAAGRLSVAEFDERSAIVSAARTRGDLASVFADLPVPVVGQAGGERQAKARGQWREQRVMPLIVILAIVLFFVTKVWLVFLIIPVAAVLLFGNVWAWWADDDHDKKNKKRAE
ncbi:DUF1707 SHOCT-like domain-containing protein [Nocardia sp. IFM 10818]